MIHTIESPRKSIWLRNWLEQIGLWGIGDCLSWCEKTQPETSFDGQHRSLAFHPGLYKSRQRQLSTKRASVYLSPLSGWVFSLSKLLMFEFFITTTEMQLQPPSLGPNTEQKQLLEERICLVHSSESVMEKKAWRTAVYGNGRVRQLSHCPIRQEAESSRQRWAWVITFTSPPSVTFLCQPCLPPQRFLNLPASNCEPKCSTHGPVKVHLTLRSQQTKILSKWVF